MRENVWNENCWRIDNLLAWRFMNITKLPRVCFFLVINDCLGVQFPIPNKNELSKGEFMSVSANICSLSLSPNNLFLCAVSAYGTLHIYSTTTKPSWLGLTERSVCDIPISDSGKLVTRISDNTAYVISLDLQTYQSFLFAETGFFEPIHAIRLPY
jgi:hypothetical protein